MRGSIWYHTKDYQPPKSGYYLSYRVWDIFGNAGGGNYGYFYYDTVYHQWKENNLITSNDVIVYYWTDADPGAWVKEDMLIGKTISCNTKNSNRIVSNAESIAWHQVKEALNRYETVKALNQ